MAAPDIKLADIGALQLESGDQLDAVTVAYETWGRLNHPGDNAVLLLHALTGDSHAAGSAGPGHPTLGWWNPLIGSGAPIDTDRWFLVCPNALGGCRGTTGPSSSAADGTAYGSRFPRITIRDLVTAELVLSDILGIRTWAAVIGGSMGGMRALEWAVMAPDMVERAVVMATAATTTAEQIALASVQMGAIRQDPKFRGGDYYGFPDGPSDGLSLARQIGFVSYRSELELQTRFGPRTVRDDTEAREQYAIEAYLEYQGARLVDRFDANSYIALNQAMNSHDVGRGRGGVYQALRAVEAEVAVVSIDSDRLYPPRLQHELVELLPGHPQLTTVRSIRGHDAFLAEYDQVAVVLGCVLTSVPAGSRL